MIDHFNDKFSRLEREFYSLRSISCKAGMLPPITLAFIYRQFCQSICLYLDVRFLGGLNFRQNLLLKHSVDLNSRCRTKPLMQCLDVDQIAQLHHKHKLLRSNWL